MQFLGGNRPAHDLTYADVFMVPNHSTVGSRLEVDLTTPDFLRLADSFGVWSGQIRSAVETAPVLKEALQQEGPALVEVDMQAVGPMAIPFTGSARLVPGRS